MCTPCAKRRQGRIVPVNPSNSGHTLKTVPQKGNALRDKLRYTGR